MGRVSRISPSTVWNPSVNDFVVFVDVVNMVLPCGCTRLENKHKTSIKI